jgi:peptidoglycan hydrolase CwlO-like protein
MSRKVSVVFSALFILSLHASFGRAADADPAGPENLCRKEQLRIQALESDHDKMAHEIHRLHDEIRRLNETLNNIRSQLGRGEPAPSSR